MSRVLGPVLYEVKDSRKAKVLHHNRLKHFIAETVPSWVHRIRAELGVRTDNESTANDNVTRTPQTCNEIDENSLRIPPGKATENPHVSGSRPPLANNTDENSQRISSGGLSNPDTSSETAGTSGDVDRNSLRIPSPQSHSTRTRNGRPVVPPRRYDS